MPGNGMGRLDGAGDVFCGWRAVRVGAGLRSFKRIDRLLEVVWASGAVRWYSGSATGVSGGLSQRGVRTSRRASPWRAA